MDLRDPFADGVTRTAVGVSFVQLVAQSGLLKNSTSAGACIGVGCVVSRQTCFLVIFISPENGKGEKSWLMEGERVGRFVLGSLN